MGTECYYVIKIGMLWRFSKYDCICWWYGTSSPGPFSGWRHLIPWPLLRLEAPHPLTPSPQGEGENILS